MAPGLLGIFGKRDKSKSPSKNSKHSSAAHDSGGGPSSSRSNASVSIVDTAERNREHEISELSAETDYVLAETGLPTVRNSVYHAPPPPVPASSSKLNVFRRRKQSQGDRVSASSSKVNLNDSPPRLHPPKSSYASAQREASTAEGNYFNSKPLHPPPSRANLFAKYGDPHNALSTHSLPQEQIHAHLRTDSYDSQIRYETMSNPDTHSPPVPSKKASGGGGLFSWARSRDRTKSKPTRPDPDILRSVPTVDQSSFNLKSFRHVNGSTSPIPDRPPSSTSMYTPPVRPRENSFASNSSQQRISVAAFREAQARRSAAVSPVPSFGEAESPSLGKNPRLSPGVAQQQQRGRQRSSTIGSPPPVLVGPPISRAPLPSDRDYKPNLFSGSSSESTSPEEYESEEGDETLRPARKRTITQRGSASADPSPRISPVLIQPSPRTLEGSNNLNYPNSYSRSRASVSTSALVPDAAAKRASLIAQNNTSASKAPTQPVASQSRSRTVSTSSTSSDTSSSASSDDAPLASYMLPPRPGSAASNASRKPAKPLIDIAELTKHPVPRRTIDSADLEASSRRSQEISAKPPLPPKDEHVMKGRAVTQPLPKNSSDVNDRLAQLAIGLAQKGRSSPSSSASSHSPPLSSPSAKSPSPVTKLKLDTSGISSKPTPSSFSPHEATESGSSRIIPTPIRERQPAPSFSVTSRPISYASSGSVGTVTLNEPVKEADNSTRPTARMVQNSADSSATRVAAHPRPSPTPRTSSAPRVTATLVSRIPKNDVTGIKSASPSAVPPPRPFTSGLLRDNSPASSTGDSSSGRMPVTPRDGSEVGIPGSTSASSASQATSRAAGRKSRPKRASVSFMDDPVREVVKISAKGAEEKRKERRRGEAKAAIELGNVINGKGPIADDDDEETMNMGPRMNMGMGMLGANPMMNMSVPMLNVPFPTGDFSSTASQFSTSGPPNPAMNMNMGMGMGMGTNMGMGMDPSAMNMNPMMMAAHQQAMMIAKQTYQMAVAQQAMQDAADEWERGSTVSGWGGPSGVRPSVMPNTMGMPNGNMGMGNMGMGNMGMGGMFPGMGMGMGGLNPGGMNMGWQNGGGMMFPMAPRSMYSGSVYAGSEVGGGGGGGWASRSVFGENFGPSAGDRSSRMSRQGQVPSSSASAIGGIGGGGGGGGGGGVGMAKREVPRSRTKTAPSSGGLAQTPGRKGGLVGAVSPPSSWRSPP
ncbi:hypothetical protein EW146_g8902 [Bondarzewia mesenterica]|uniref:Uncharacterized protein n=1 Tax=Bondarzewia mesenterica TaxID=1095465 RepID=A0A4S4LC23_9AGAM|nr:hypothetical protein EW146_g8902 [Bondarzewia mesenterica]